MMDQQIASRLRADLFLLHAPSVYDFREPGGVQFAYLSDSDSVNVTPGYEMSPLGWFPVKQRPALPGMNAVTGRASGVARLPDRDVYRSSRPRWTLHC
jgi:clorobiocin biosynthesis protein CloN6